MIRMTGPGKWSDEPRIPERIRVNGVEIWP